MVGGVVATGVMTGVFDLWRSTRRGRPVRAGGAGWRIPPEVVAMRTASRAGWRRRMTRQQRERFTLASHFAYGAGMGALYGAWRGGSGGACCAAGEAGRGVLFGLAVYGVSYGMWLPATGLVAPVNKQGAWMTGALLSGHVAYGAVLGTVVGRGLRREGSRQELEASQRCGSRTRGSGRR